MRRQQKKRGLLHRIIRQHGFLRDFIGCDLNMTLQVRAQHYRKVDQFGMVGVYPAFYLQVAVSNWLLQLFHPNRGLEKLASADA